MKHVLLLADEAAIGSPIILKKSIDAFEGVDHNGYYPLLLLKI